MNWTELEPHHKVEAVRELVERQLHTYSQAGAKLGTSREAVAGVISRAKTGPQPIKGPPRPKLSGAAKAKADAGKKKFKKPKHQGFPNFVGLPSAVPAKPDPFLAGDAWTALPGSLPVALSELDPHGCRWPVGDAPMLFCNLPSREGSVYCTGHHARAYRELPAVKRKETR